jgi:hypothetical protein
MVLIANFANVNDSLNASLLRGENCTKQAGFKKQENIFRFF